MHTVEFSPKLARINDYTFYGCGALTDAILYEGIDEIGNGAFYGCSRLGRVSLPRSLDKVFENAFAECTILDNMIYDGTLAEYAVISVGEYNDYLDYAAIESLS